MTDERDDLEDTIDEWAQDDPEIRDRIDAALQRRTTDLVHRYVRFIFAEYEADPRGWITKNPPSVAEFAARYDGIGA